MTEIIEAGVRRHNRRLGCVIWLLTPLCIFALVAFVVLRFQFHWILRPILADALAPTPVTMKSAGWVFPRTLQIHDLMLGPQLRIGDVTVVLQDPASGFTDPGDAKGAPRMAVTDPFSHNAAAHMLQIDGLELGSLLKPLSVRISISGVVLDHPDIDRLLAQMPVKIGSAQWAPSECLRLQDIAVGRRIRASRIQIANAATPATALTRADIEGPL